MLGDDGPCEIKGCGVVPMKRLVNGAWIDINLENVLFIPGFKRNLVFLGVCTGRGYNVVLSKDALYINDGRELIVEGVKQSNQLYRLFLKSSLEPEAHVEKSNLQLWHERLAHINVKSVRDTEKLVDGMKITNNSEFFCEPCQVGKSH